MSNSPRQVFNSVQQDVPSTLKTSYITAAKQLAVYEQVVQATSNTTYPSYTLTLPSLGEAAGRVYAVSATIANAQAITLVDAGDDPTGVSYTLDTDGDAVLLFCDGSRWWELVNEVA